MRYLISTVSYMCLASGVVYAQVCKTVPSCKSLGYDSEVSDCTKGKKYLTCPFDNSKVFCSDVDDVPSPSSVPGCQKVGLVGSNYQCTSCYTGYSLSNGVCNQTCSYTLTEKPTIEHCSSYQSCNLGSATGSTTYYGSNCKSCESGYEISNGECVQYCGVGDYSYTTPPNYIEHCTQYEYCSLGSARYYYKKADCDDCENGFALVYISGTYECKDYIYNLTSRSGGSSITAYKVSDDGDQVTLLSTSNSNSTAEDAIKGASTFGIVNGPTDWYAPGAWRMMTKNELESLVSSMEIWLREKVLGNFYWYWSLTPSTTSYGFYWARNRYDWKEESGSNAKPLYMLRVSKSTINQYCTPAWGYYRCTEW